MFYCGLQNFRWTVKIFKQLFLPQISSNFNPPVWKTWYSGYYFFWNLPHFKHIWHFEDKSPQLQVIIAINLSWFHVVKDQSESQGPGTFVLYYKLWWNGRDALCMVTCVIIGQPKLEIIRANSMNGQYWFLVLTKPKLWTNMPFNHIL